MAWPFDEDLRKIVMTAVLAIVLAAVAAFLIPGAQAAETKTLLNVSYDPRRGIKALP